MTDWYAHLDDGEIAELQRAARRGMGRPLAAAEARAVLDWGVRHGGDIQFRAALAGTLVLVLQDGRVSARTTSSHTPERTAAAPRLSRRVA